jgi:uncharacterized protein (TIGR00730 family)
MATTVTIFGSSVPRENDIHYATAFECGKYLAGSGFSVCNGGYGGTMEAAAKGARSAGGSTIGVTVAEWPREPNQWIQTEIKAATLIERLIKLVELGDAYVVLPGGTGTLLEFAFVLELINKSIISRKPIVLLGDFWQGVLEALRNEPGRRVGSENSQLVQTAQKPSDVVRLLRASLQALK